MQIFDLRQGKYPFERRNFAVFRSIEYITIQAMYKEHDRVQHLTCCSCFAIYFLVFLAAFIATFVGGLAAYYSATLREIGLKMLVVIILDVIILVLPVRVLEIVYVPSTDVCPGALIVLRSWFRYVCATPDGGTVSNRRLLAAGEFVAAYAFLYISIGGCGLTRTVRWRSSK